MLECPRCGFVQPDDRYCANCGLDVLSYKPKPTPWHDKILKSPIFHLSLALALIIGIFAYIQGKNDSQINVVDGGETEAIEEQVAQSPPSPSPEPKVAPRETPRPKARSQAPPPKPKPSPQPVRPPSPPTESRAATPPPEQIESQQQAALQKLQESQTEPATDAPTSLAVQYYEVSQVLLDQIFSESAVLRETTNARSVVHPDREQLLGQLRQAHSLPGGRTSRIQLTTNIDHNFLTNEEPEERHGMFVSLTPSRLDEDRVNFTFSIRLQLGSEEPGDIVSVQLAGNYDMKSSEALIVAGIIPHRRPNPEASLSGTPLSIMDSPDFAAESPEPTEFIMVITAR